MKSPAKKLIFALMAVLCLVLASTIWWLFDDSPTETKLQSFQIGPDTTINFFMRSYWDSYLCLFEIQTNKQVAIPKTSFDGGMYASGEVSGKKWSWEDYTKYKTYVGTNSGVIGIASAAYDTNVLLVIFDTSNYQFYSKGFWDEGSEGLNKRMQFAEALLPKLQADFPEDKLYLDGTEEARLMRYNRNYPE